MSLKIIGLGSNLDLENSLGNELIKTFESGDFNKAFIITAFSSLNAVSGIDQLAKSNKIKDLTIITGIDQKGTSKEALEELLNSHSKSYVFYNPSSIIFHPKVYFFESKNKIKLIIGSSNLTSQGLFQNMEASICLEVNKTEDLSLIEDLKKNYSSLFDLTDANLKEVTPELIESLLSTGLIPTEAERKKLYAKNNVSEKKDRKKIIEIFPKRSSAKINSIFKKSKFMDSISDVEEDIAEVEFFDNNEEEVLVWKSSALKERDLNIPTGDNTNPTGSMLFKKGETEGIDQRHYFREDVFNELEWINDPPDSHIERTLANFKIIIDATDMGIFNLKLSHNTNIQSETYKQKNSMTNISWGKAKEFIAKPELLGKKLELLKKGDLFILKIE
jgi:HKD family nuclease